MSDNIRWLIALSAASVTLYTVIAGRRRRSGTRKVRRFDRRTRHEVTLAVGGLLVFWSAAELPPFTAWLPDGGSGLAAMIGDAQSPEVLVACLAYLAIVVASSRGLIGLPIYRQLQARANELRQMAQSHCFSERGEHIVAAISRAERLGVRRIGSVVVSVPLPDVLGANRTLNGIEKQMLADLSGADLRLAATQIAALLPSTDGGVAAAKAISDVVRSMDRGEVTDGEADSQLRNSCATALILLHRRRDVPQQREVDHIRVSIWLTMVGLATTYALSVTWSGHAEILIAGALGGLLGSYSALLTNRELSLGMVVLSPVAGALNALGGTIVIGFLAQDQIQVLGAVFRGVWADGTASVTALAVAVLLGFSGGLFSRIAVAGTAPLLGTNGKPDGTPPAAALVPPGTAASGSAGPSDRSTAPAEGNGHAPERRVPPAPPRDEVEADG